jgi:DNA invertase Pin-like site-specific DNA recombinase
MTKGKQVRRSVIYTRVSTIDQNTDNQLRELRAVAERNGWQVVKELSDKGFSGAKGRDKRPGLRSTLERRSKERV